MADNNTAGKKESTAAPTPKPRRHWDIEPTLDEAAVEKLARDHEALEQAKDHPGSLILGPSDWLIEE